MPVAELVAGKLLDGAIGWAVGRVADTAGKQLRSSLSNEAARKELVEIGAAGIAAAASVAPELALELGSEAYLHNVLAPALLAILVDPTQGFKPEQAAAGYVRRFVEPFLRGREVDDVFTEVFHLEPERLTAAFTALVEAIRSGLYKSVHWREPIASVALEEVRMGVLGIHEQLAALRPKTRNLEQARQDAKIGSYGLRSWSKTVAGLHLDRPELRQIRDRIRANPAATTLVTGAAGSGKSALLAELTSKLEQDGMTVFAIKADQLPETVRNQREIAQALGMAGELADEIETLAAAEPLVLIVDQLDAVSDVMDRTSQRMQLLLQLATRWRKDRSDDFAPPVHVIVSSRPFEARHDARFQSLRADEVVLSLPPWEAIARLLDTIGIDASAISETLRDALRRPFLLKLFVDIAQRGEPTAALAEGELLNAWLRTAPLGNQTARKGVLSLLKLLAMEMTATETLWRPADKFDQDWSEAVERAEACELLIRRGGLIGFAHQSWLDEFQARAFTSGREVAEYAWSSQDGLFGRATILRALERLRAYEPDAFADALDALLGEPCTRRHIRHLVVDLLATQSAPLDRERGWLLRLIREDIVLARRGIAKLVEHWSGWREALKPQIGVVSAIPDLAHTAAAMVIAEAKVDATEAQRIVLTTWPKPDDDQRFFEVCWRAGLWSAAIRDRVIDVFRRTPFSSHAVADYASHLRKADQAGAAAELIGLYLSSLAAEARSRISFHEVEKLAEVAPVAFVDAVLPSFLHLICEGQSSESRIRDRFDQSQTLPFDWQNGDHDRSVFGSLQQALSACAQCYPEAFRRFAERLSSVELDEAQALVAEAYGSAGSSLADEAATWLLQDLRRLSVGTAHVHDENNVGHLLQDYSTRELLRGITPHLTPERLAEVAAAIEGWDPYTADARAESSPRERRRWRRWTEEQRAQLLELLPNDALSARRRRQVHELVADQPRIRPGRGFGMASFVGSPMTSDAMARATDADLFRMIDEVNDDVGDRWRAGRRRNFEGGVGQLSQAFGAFGKAHPRRAIALVMARFQPRRHEQAAGALIRELRDVEAVPPSDLVNLIWELHRRGFTTETWRRDVAWALEAIASRTSGLDDETIKLLEDWIVRDPSVIADRVARREHLDQINRERNGGNETRTGPALFGYGLGGMMVLPQGNYSILTAIAAGVLRRDPPDFNAWLEILERHAGDPEDPHVWAVLMLYHGRILYNADRERVFALLDTLWASFPSAFEPITARTFWACRQMLPPTIRRQIGLAWLTSSEAKTRQLAGEFFMAGSLVDLDDTEAKVIADAILAGPEGPGRNGAFYAAAAAWREGDPNLRSSSHLILAKAAREADGDVADAISTALSTDSQLRPDEFTRELIEFAVENGALLRASLNGRFLDALQDLLLHPGFEDLVLSAAEASLDIMLERQHGYGALVDGDLVSIAVALQRAQTARRGRAMNLYERLLDNGVYGADQAAKASLQRG